MDAAVAPARVHCLDAQAIDHELGDLLEEQFSLALGRFSGRLASNFQPELQALVRFALWLLGALRGATPGQALQNLHTAAGAAVPAALHVAGASLEPPGRRPRLAGAVPRGRRLLHGLLVVLLPWAWARAHGLLAARAERDGALEYPRLLRAMARLEGAVQALSVACTLRFLVDGKYASLPAALLGLRLVYTRPHAPRQPEFDFMNQQLGWQAVADTLVSLRQLFSAPPAAPGVVEAAPTGPLAVLRRWLSPFRPRTAAAPAHSCALCGAAPMHTPHLASCGCAFCYFCLATATMAGGGQTRCRRCGQRCELGPRCDATNAPRLEAAREGEGG